MRPRQWPVESTCWVTWILWGSVLEHPSAGAGEAECLGSASVIALVMQATDAFLFGLVLSVFAYAITFGFAFDLPETARAKLPQWMRVDGISELKITLLIAGALRLVEIGRFNYHTTSGAQHPPDLDKSTSGERLAVAADLNLRSIQPSKRRYPKPHV